MSKIICDVCGTIYQDSADFCPICGYAQGEYPVQQDGFLGNSSGTHQPAHKSIFDYDHDDGYAETQPEPPEYDNNDDFEDMDGYEEPSRTSTIIIVILVMMITLLLVAIGFLFFRFYLPNRMAASQPATVVTEATLAPETQESTEPTIPCSSLALTSGVTQLTRPGQYWLLHVTVLPEDTTDPLVFRSEDESVVTVNEFGRLTAESEGETSVYITCGDKEIKCQVIVKYEDAPEPAATEQSNTAPESVEHTDLPEQPETTEKTEPEKTEQPAETEPEQPEETKTPSEKVVLKLEKSDVSSTVKGVSFELKLACDLKPEDVTWLTMDSKVAIVKNGVVTTIGSGKTKIVAQYQGQQAECIVRCNF